MEEKLKLLDKKVNIIIELMKKYKVVPEEELNELDKMQVFPE